MKDCIFCKIATKKIPSYTVYADANFLAFLDINPQTPGHVQVIPKKHYRWVWDLPTDGNGGLNLREYFAVAQKMALAQRKAFGVDFILSKTVGDEVSHAHIWVFPSNDAKGDKKDFEGNRTKLIEALK